MIKGHGGNVQDLAELHNCSVNEIIDMSSNINPLGPPEGLEKFIIDNIDLIRSLPQPDAFDMASAFSGYYKVPLNRVMAGNGTTWFIYTLPTALKSRKVLIVGPTYSDYQDSCIMNSVPFEFCMSEELNNFLPDINKISNMAENADTVIICNPNNPTGSLISKNSIVELLKSHPLTYFIIDESYLPFVDGAEKISLVSESMFSNLIILSSMSKIFRIPGLRTGCICADPDVIEKLAEYYQPWSVNALSQAATIHLLKNRSIVEPFLKMTRSFVEAERQIFADRVNLSKNIKLYPSNTYFVLAKLTGNINSDELYSKVGEHKILIRNCANFKGLSDRFVRFSLRDRETNLMLAEILTTD